MKIQKVGHQSLRNSKNISLLKSEDNARDDIPLLVVDLEDDSDNCELAKLNSELGMLEGQLCSIPYELYDLPDLREILSLDTWNYCLIEEERFYLSAYLPDVDQQTFRLTMEELFDGSNLHFGNPVDVFFQRLRGGLYPPKVAQYREALQFIRRKKYYHSLKSYHERMIRMFMDMRKFWNQFDSSSTVEERISMWTKRRKQKAIKLLDLNKFPKDDQTLDEEVILDTKEMRPVESKRAKNELRSLSTNQMKAVAPNCRGKGVLKMKTSANGLLPNANTKTIGRVVSEQFRSVPKGVLKIVPKVPPFLLQQSENVSRGAQPTFPVRPQGLPDLELSSLPAYWQSPYGAGFYESPFQGQKVADSRVHLTLNQQRRCFLDQQESIVRSRSHSESSPPSDDITVFGQDNFFAGNARREFNEEDRPLVDQRAARRYTFGGETPWPNLLKGTEDFSQRSLETLPLDIQHQRHMALMKENPSIFYPRIPEAVYRTSATDNGQQMFMVSSSNPMRDTSGKRPEKLSSKPNVLDRFKDEPTLHLTYKRRKGLAKVNSLDTGKTLMVGADLNSNQHIEEGAKAEKIKFKMWKDKHFHKEP